MKLNLLVIRSEEPALLQVQYSALGFTFEKHRHGTGPIHFASEQDGWVFEIYPLSQPKIKADNSLRMGFEVERLEEVLTKALEYDWEMLSLPQQREWGYTAVIRDRDGRKVELKEKTG